MRNLRIILTILMLTGLAAAVVGCGSSDDNPAAVQTDTMTLDNTTAEDFSLQALDVVNQMVGEVPDIANADFGSWAQAKTGLAKANTDSVTWDPAQNAWVFTYDGPLFAVEAPNYWNFSLDLWVQYRNAVGPVQFPLAATTMELRYGTGMDMHMVEADMISDLAYEMNTNMVVSYLGEGGSYGVTGSGDTMVDIAQTGGDHAENGRFSMDWSLDVTVSDQGCPSGTATVNAQQYQMVVTYDGQGNAAWILTGPNYHATGTETLGCGQVLN